jgi:acylphosphatase
MNIRRRVIVHGRVHGIGFRIAVARAAHSRGVAGWVRNRTDGTVEAVLEGAADEVESVLAFCRVGPRGAAVTHVEETAEEPEGLPRFEIL